MSILTAAILVEKGACAEHVEKFKQAFGPDGLDLADTSRDAFFVEVAVLAELDFDWAADNLLTPPACKAYSEARATAYKAYSKAIATAYKAYSKAIAPADKAYSEARATADKAYSEARATALLAALRIGGAW